MLVSGCGAVTERFYLPALQLLQNQGAIEVVAVSDPDKDRLDFIGRRLKGAARYATLDSSLEQSRPELLIVASPAQFHREQTLSGFAYGCNVLCEKPLATSTADCAAMIEAAKRSGRVLGVGLFRRHFPSVRAIQSLLASHILGRVTSFSVMEGEIFRWPVKSASFFLREQGGGGVLVDSGPHTLDLLRYWLGELELVAYEDDAAGGVEANALIRLQAADVEGTVRLSRDVPMSNRHVITCERGWVAYDCDAAGQFTIGWEGVPFTIKAGASLPPPPEPMWPARKAALAAPNDLAPYFLANVRNVVEAVDSGAELTTTGEDALAGMTLIEQCYASRKLMPMPWLSDGERARMEALAAGQAAR